MTLKKEIEEDSDKWKHMPCLWIKRIDIVNMLILSKSNLQIQCNPFQNTSLALNV